MADLYSLSLTVDSAGAVSGFANFKNASRDAGDAGSKAANQIKDAFDQLSKAFGGLTEILGAGALSREIIKSSSESEDALAQLEARIRSTGGAAGESVSKLTELAYALQEQTGFSHAAVEGAEAFLLTMGNISGDVLVRATAAVTDLARGMGTDAQSAALQLGKALEDPSVGLTMLRRTGVTFTEGQQELIKSLYETGDAAKAQNIILDVVQQKFGGAAAAAKDTLGGALRGLKNDFHDLLELSPGTSSPIAGFINALGWAVQSMDLALKTNLSTWDKFTNAIANVTAQKPDLLTLSGWEQAIAGVITGYKSLDGMTDEQTKAYEAADAAMKKRTASLVAHQKAQDETAASIKKAVGASQEELDKQNALNAGYNKGTLAIALLNIQEDAKIQKTKNAVGNTVEIVKALNDYVDKMAVAKSTAAELADSLDKETQKFKEQQEQIQRTDDAFNKNIETVQAFESAADAIVHPIDAFTQSFLDAESAAELVDAALAKAGETTGHVTAVWDAYTAAITSATAQTQNFKDLQAAMAAEGGPGGDAFGQKKFSTVDLDAGLKQEIKDANAATKEWERSMRNVFDVVGGIVGALSQADQQTALLVQAMLKVAESAADAARESSTIGGNGGSGAASGAQSGSAGGPVGAVIGAIVGIFEGGLAETKALEAEQARIAAEWAAREQAFVDSMTALNTAVRSITDSMAGTEDQFIQRLQSVLSAAKDAQDKFEAAGYDAQGNGLTGHGNFTPDILHQIETTGTAPAWAGVPQSVIDQWLALHTAVVLATAATQREIDQDANLRILRATGHNDEADALEFQNRLLADMQHAIDNGLDPSLTLAADFAEYAAKQAEEARQKLETTNNLMIRLYQAEGDSADELALKRQMEMDAASDSDKEILKLIYQYEDQASAAQAAADAIAESIRKINEAVSDLQVQFDVFGTTPGDQVDTLRDLFGFGGMSDDQIRALFTKVTPGQELTDAQRELNREIQQFLDAEAKANPTTTATDTGGGGGGGGGGAASPTSASNSGGLQGVSAAEGASVMSYLASANVWLARIEYNTQPLRDGASYQAATPGAVSSARSIDHVLAGGRATLRNGQGATRTD